MSFPPSLLRARAWRRRRWPWQNQGQTAATSTKNKQKQANSKHYVDWYRLCCCCIILYFTESACARHCRLFLIVLVVLFVARGSNSHAQQTRLNKKENSCTRYHPSHWMWRLHAIFTSSDLDGILYTSSLFYLTLFVARENYSHAQRTKRREQWETSDNDERKRSL